MKFLCQIDRPALIRRGINYDHSTVTVDLDVGSLTEEAREWLARRSYCGSLLAEATQEGLDQIIAKKLHIPSPNVHGLVEMIGRSVENVFPKPPEFTEQQ